jgi:raffinose/stachyose/melibiose transport system permease protein
MAFLAPAALIFSLVVILPFMVSVWYSMTDWNGISSTMHFIGIQNYLSIFSGSSAFLSSFWFTISISFVIVVFTMILATGLAAVLADEMHSGTIFRAIFFIPNTMGGVVLGYIWRFIFVLGFEYLGKRTGLGIFSLPWLGTKESAFAALVVVSVWQSVGYVMTIMIAALVSVPYELSEAAIIDGASSWHVFWRVKLPCCMPHVTVCLFWVIACTLKMFDLNVALTKGGPYGSTTPMALQIYYDAFNSNNYGLANAESIVFFIIVFAITSLQMMVSRKKETALQ